VTLALRAYRLRWVLPCQLALAIVGSLFGNISVAVPSLSGVGAVPVAMLSALLGVILLALPINATWPVARTVSVRDPAMVLMTANAVVLVPIMLASVILGLVWVGSAGFEYLGTFSWLLSIQLLVGTLLSGRFQALGPTVYVMLCALLGRVDSSVQPWAWPLADVPAIAHAGTGLGALVLAVALFAVLGLHDAEN